MAGRRLAGLRRAVVHRRDGPIARDELLAIQLVENALREDLRPVEQARAYRRLMDDARLVEPAGRRRAAVAQSGWCGPWRCSNCPSRCRTGRWGGELPASVAYEVSRLEDPEQQLALAQAVVEHGLKRSEVAEAVQAVRAKRPAPSRRPDPVEVDLGEGIKVRVTLSRASGVSATQALRKALKALQDRDRSDDQAA